MSERAVLPPKPEPVLGMDDSISEVGPSVRAARKFSVTVAEEALQRMAPRAIEIVTEALAQRIAHEQYGAIADTVAAFLRDRAWAEPIIRQAIQEAVREYVRDIVGASPKGAGG